MITAWTQNSRWQLAWDIQPLSSNVKMDPKNKMKTKIQNTCHIGCLGQRGTRLPKESNQPEVEKCSTGSASSLEKPSDGNHAQGDLPAGPSRVTPTKKK